MGLESQTAEGEAVHNPRREQGHAPEARSTYTPPSQRGQPRPSTPARRIDDDLRDFVGPVTEDEKLLQYPGHRGDDFRKLYRAIHPRLQELFGTKQPVFLSTSSAWGVIAMPCSRSCRS